MQVKQRKKYTRQLHSDDPISVSFSSNLGNTIRNLRLSYRISRRILGEHCKCSPQQIEKYEIGVNRLSVFNAIKFCDFFGVTLNDLVTKDYKNYTNTNSKRLSTTIRAYEKLPESSQKLVTNYIKLIKKIN